MRMGRVGVRHLPVEGGDVPDSEFICRQYRQMVKRRPQELVLRCAAIQPLHPFTEAERGVVHGGHLKHPPQEQIHGKAIHGKCMRLEEVMSGASAFNCGAPVAAAAHWQYPR